MPGKRAFLLVLVLIGLACLRLAADDAKIPGKLLLIKEDATLFVQDPDGTNRRKIAERVDAAAFSPDAKLVAYVAGKAVHVFSLLDGQSVTVAHFTDGSVQTLVWSPDQKHLAYDDVGKKGWDLFLASYPPAGETPRNLGHWYESISFSPNGKFIVHPSFDSTAPPGPPNILETVNVETGKRETIYKGATTIWEAKYSPDGSIIAFMMTDPEDDTERDSGGAVTDLWLLRLDTKKAEKIMQGVFEFDWSPDGKFLAISKGTDVGDYPPDDGAIFIRSIDGKDQFQISKDAPSMRARFSPDSREVIFVDYNAFRFVIADLATRKLTPIRAYGPKEYNYAICDWK
jgi:Tol biopolymer transport system component